MAEKTEAARAKPTIKAAVARGRTIVVDGMRQGPGVLVELPADEANRLMGLGFLSNPYAPAVVPSQGPQFRGPVDGVVKPT